MIEFDKIPDVDEKLKSLCEASTELNNIDIIRWRLRGKGPDAMNAFSVILRIETLLFKHYITTGKFKNLGEKALKTISGKDGVEVARKVIENLLKAGWTPGDHVRSTRKAAIAKCGISVYEYKPKK